MLLRTATVGPAVDASGAVGGGTTGDGTFAMKSNGPPGSPDL